MKTYSTFSRGSEWRKWELHIHTPESGLSNNFTNWDDYVKILFTTAIEENVAVLGITDYFSVDGYKKIIQDYIEKEDKLNELFDNNQALIKKIKEITIFPNIEFRLNKLVGKNRINYHVVFSNEIPIKDIEENFLHDIEFVYECEPFDKGEKRKLKKNNLIELGAKLKKEQTSFTGNDFEVGCMNAVVCDDKISELLENNKTKFKGKYLICLPADEDLSSVSWKSQDHLTRKILLQKSNIFFSTNKNTIEFGLGRKSDSVKEFISEFKSLKPCLSSCDAHSCDEISKWLGKSIIEYDINNKSKINCEKKITWIKAEPTFEGFKQILCEPESRVIISNTFPSNKKAYNVIDKIKFIDKSSNNKFPNNEIGFNPDLNAIIGGKSSGKSLLMHLMAISIGNKTDQKDYKDILKNVELEVYYADEPNKKRSADDKRIIEFLPQLYIEQIVRNKQSDLKENYFNDFAKDLIQQDDEIKELFNSHSKTISENINQIEINIKNWINFDTELKNAIAELAQLGDKTAISNELTILKVKIDELTKKSGLSDEDLKLYKELTESNIESNDILRKLKEHEDEVNRLDEFSNKTILQNIMSSISFESNDKYVIQQFDIFKNNLQKTIELEIKTVTETLKERKEKIESKKTEKNTVIQQNNQKLIPILEKNKIQDEIKTLEDNIKSENQKLDFIIKKETEIKEIKEKRNLCVFIVFYNKIIESYKNLTFSINTLIGAKWEKENTRLTLTTSYVFNTNQFFESISANINVKAYLSNQFPDCGFFESDYVYPFSNENQDINDKNHIENISKILTHCISDSNRFGNFKSNGNTKEVLRALFKDCWRIDFDIKKGNDSLQNMSEGKKGIVILQLYLSLSKADYPILIDQPEDNLDNRTVYQELNDYITQCKKGRQIIIVSHNANLVVNTDAENIIVANQSGEDGKDNKEFRFEYVNGALENTFSFDEEEEKKINGILYKKGIREHVCEILEGGTDAFKKREEKYHLK